MANEKYKIRKNCVEVSVALSYICSKEIREKILVPIYINFLEDPMKYVSDLALIALGPFIASFANSEQSEHHQTFSEVLVNNIYNFNYGKINIDFSLSNTSFRDDYDYGEYEDIDEYKKFSDFFFTGQTVSKLMPINNNNKNSMKKMLDNFLTDKKDQLASTSNQNLNNISMDEELKEEFNSFNYWREPIMNIDELLDADEKNCSEQDKDDDCMEIEAGYNQLSMANQFEDLVTIYRLEKEDLLVSNIEKCIKLIKDTIVPKELLFYFLKNLLSNYGSNIYQADINCICAFSLPAVAFTLGEENWPCLRVAFNLLVVGVSTNIRLILASSLHELAKIIGPFYTNRDILPALFTFMDQNDEVRERILKILSPLVNILDKTQQKMILRKLPEFYKLDNEYNWRFRVEFINQFTKLVHLFDKPKQFSQIIIPMIFSLLEDQVAEVRKCTIPLLSLTIQHLYDLTRKIISANKLKESILDQIYYKLYLSKKWSFRQLFIMVCDNIVETFSLPVETFEEKLLTPLLNLSNDKVNNVRLTLSRVLSNVDFQKYFEECSRTRIEDTIKQLTKDEDQDVRSYFVPPAIATPLTVDQQQPESQEDTNDNLLFNYERENDKSDGSVLQKKDFYWTIEVLRGRAKKYTLTTADDKCNSLDSIEALTNSLNDDSYLSNSNKSTDTNEESTLNRMKNLNNQNDQINQTDEINDQISDQILDQFDDQKCSKLSSGDNSSDTIEQQTSELNDEKKKLMNELLTEFLSERKNEFIIQNVDLKLADREISGSKM